MITTLQWQDAGIRRIFLYGCRKGFLLCSCLGDIGVFAYISGAVGCVENAGEES